MLVVVVILFSVIVEWTDKKINKDTDDLNSIDKFDIRDLCGTSYPAHVPFKHLQTFIQIMM